eukprot:1183121-Prymnesium_polylepis.1
MLQPGLLEAERRDAYGQLVLVHLDKAFGGVVDLARIVQHDKESVGTALGLSVRRVPAAGLRAKLAVQRPEEGCVRARTGAAGIVEEADDAAGPLGDQVEDDLVILEVDVIAHDALTRVHLLLESDDVADEEIVQQLVRQ